MVAAGGRQLSLVRVVTALAVTAAAGWVTVDRVASTLDDDEAAPVPVVDPWFAPYVDVTLEPGTPFEDPDTAPVDDLALAFVVADPDHPCRPSWGGAYSLDEASTALELDRRIVRVRQWGGDVIASFGGAANDELAVACDDTPALTRAYRDVVERYHLGVVDVDVEGAALADTAGAERRAEALATVQGEQDLNVWLTLPVSPAGLPEDAVAVVDATLDGGVDLAGVNLMTMDFGATRAEGQAQLDATVSALDAAHEQLAGAFARAGHDLTDAEVWARMGATPMLGQNDVPGERFELADAEALVDLARDRGLGRVSVWSLNRDQPCGPNDTGAASPSCSGTDEEAGAFVRAFAVLDERPRPNGDDAVVAPTGRGEVAVDDPATSPHPIWDAADAYAEGDRVVWHHNVYEAKWWNRDTAPDTPVDQAWDTPWRLLGPVLPGDQPPAVDLLPAGTYPRWRPDATYHAGDVVQLDGLGYRARWWTQGQAPDAAGSDPFAWPWEALAAG